MKEYSLFSYHQGNSFLHKMPSIVKMLFIPLISLLTFNLPFYFALSLFLLQLILAFFLKFSLAEQITDLKPALYYFSILEVFLLLLSLFQKDFSIFLNADTQKNYTFSILKLLTILQSTSLFYKSTSSLEIRRGIHNFERKISKKSRISDSLFLFLNFIPAIGAIWKEEEKAWFARGGRRNIKMLVKLLPVLFSIGMKKAYLTSRAIEIRKNN